MGIPRSVLGYMRANVSWIHIRPLPTAATLCGDRDRDLSELKSVLFPTYQRVCWYVMFSYPTWRQLQAVLNFAYILVLTSWSRQLQSLASALHRLQDRGEQRLEPRFLNWISGSTSALPHSGLEGLAAPEKWVKWAWPGGNCLTCCHSTIHSLLVCVDTTSVHRHLKT